MPIRYRNFACEYCLIERLRKGSVGACVSSNSHRHPFNYIEYLYDIRLVCASPKSERQKVVYRCTRELGYRILRISLPSAGKPDWLFSLQLGGVEDSAGGHHTRGFRSVRDLLYAPAVQARFRMGWFVWKPGEIMFS